MRGSSILFLCLLRACTWAATESARQMPAVPVSTPPTLDGVISPGEYPDAGKAERFYDNATGQIGDQLTEAWITYDQNAVYVGFYMRDSNPAGIVADQIRDGSNMDGDDQAVFRIDPFATGQGTNTSRFAVNPRGVKTETFAGGRAQKIEWRGEWQAAAKIVADGWMAEMRIPWSLLDLPPGSGPRDMTINFLRFERARLRRTMWSDRTSSERFDLEGVWKWVVPPAVKFRSRPQFLAYGLGEYDRDRNKFSGDAGLDIKYRISPQLTSVASINPDFKNVEQQVESISFTRSERLLGDARPFFSEGADYFTMGSSFALGRLFYSRRIRDFDAGVKLVGRATPKMPIGVLATVGQHREFNAVMNMGYEFLPRSIARVYALGRREAGLRETMVGGRVVHQTGNFIADAELSRLDGTTRKASAYSYSLDWQDGLWYDSFRYLSVPGSFAPRLSLINHRDVRGWSNYSAYNKQWTGKRIRSFSADAYVNDWKRFDGRPYQDGYEVSAGVSTSDSQVFSARHESRRFSGVRDDIYGFYYERDADNRYRGFEAYTEVGRRDGARYFLTQPSVRGRILRKLDLGLALVHEHLRGDRDQWIGTAGWEFDANRSITGRVVKNGSNVNSYLAYRHSGQRGNDLYVILGDPNADRFRFRIAVKIVIPF